MKLGMVPSRIKELFIKEVKDNPDAGMRILFHNGEIVSSMGANNYKLNDMSIDINGHLLWVSTRQGPKFWDKINKGSFNHVFNTNHKGL